MLSATEFGEENCVPLILLPLDARAANSAWAGCYGLEAKVQLPISPVPVRKCNQYVFKFFQGAPSAMSLTGHELNVNGDRELIHF